MLPTDFESILQPADEVYKDKMNVIKAEKKGKTSYQKKINTHVPSGWCVHSTFAYGYVPHPLKMYRGKDCVEEFVEYLKVEVKRQYLIFPQQPMIELTDGLKEERKEGKICYICLPQRI